MQIKRLDFNKQTNSVLGLAKAVQICKFALLDLTNMQI